jgi:hypothetical protein
MLVVMIKMVVVITVISISPIYAPEGGKHGNGGN